MTAGKSWRQMMCGVALGAALAFAAGAVAVAQEIKLEEVEAADQVPPEKIKPRVAVFSDHRKDPLVDQSVGLMKFSDWAKHRPIQKEALALFPDFAEPAWKSPISGRPRRMRLHVYVAETRFIVSRPLAVADLKRYATLEFLERIDPAIKSHTIQPADVHPLKEGADMANRHPARAWCGAGGISVCIQSRYKLEGRLPIGIMLLNKIRDSDRKIADFIEFQSELRAVDPAELDEPLMRQLTLLDAPVTGVLEQSVFYVNQIMQFARYVAVFQKHPSEAGKTVVTAFIALGIESDLLEKKKEYDQVPVLRNLVPAQVLSGNSSFNTGNSISGGLPVYARNRVKAIAALLEDSRGSAAFK